MKKRLFIVLLWASFLHFDVRAQTTQLWGMTRLGGLFNMGVIFKTDAAGENLDSVYSFTHGDYPMGSLMFRQGSAGLLYGLTGGDGKGVLFEYDITTGTYTVRWTFDGTGGKYPHGSLIRASNGSFYGMTYGGGAHDKGVIFEYDPVFKVYTKRFDFDGTNGSYPKGSLMQATNGKLYGMTYEGGAHNAGVLFEYDPATHTFTKKFDFETGYGISPMGAPVEAPNGKLYGMTSGGGDSSGGVIFEFDPATGVYTKKFDFGGADGKWPHGSLMRASNGRLYGMTTRGGAYDKGVLFEYDPAANTYTKKWDFDGTNGGVPQGTLMQASSGKLYGMTTYGGAYDMGVIFEFDLNNDTYARKSDFAGNNGRNPYYGALIEVHANTLSMEKPRPSVRLFPNPVTGRLHLRMTERPRRVWVETPMGTVLYATSRTEKDMTLDMTGYPPAVYLIRIQTANGVLAYKVVKR